MLYKIGGLLSGTALGAGFVCNMDDLIYGQLRRNVILPFKQTILNSRQKQMQLDDIMELTSGTANFVQQFKPHALGRTNVKSLLLNDEDYATPQDHYFGYINKRQGANNQTEREKEIEVMKSLNLEILLPPTFNVETGTFDEPKLLDSQGNPINEAEMDIFELARLRGTNLKNLKELMNDTQQIKIEQKQVQNLTGQRHTKKEYEKLKSISVDEIVKMTKQDTVKKQFQDDSLEGIVKVEKKKSFKRTPKVEQRQKEQEIQKLLEQPQDINYERAMKLYEDQPLEAKEITAKDKRRLRRLKQKAEKQLQNETQGPSNNEENVQQQAKATNIKIEPSIIYGSEEIFGHSDVQIK